MVMGILEAFTYALQGAFRKQVEILKYRNKALENVVKDLRYPRKIADKQAKLLMESIREEVLEIVRSELGKAFLEDRKAAIASASKYLDSAEGVHSKLFALDDRLHQIQAKIDLHWERLNK